MRLRCSPVEDTPPNPDAYSDDSTGKFPVDLAGCSIIQKCIRIWGVPFHFLSRPWSIRLLVALLRSHCQCNPQPNSPSTMERPPERPLTMAPMQLIMSAALQSFNPQPVRRRQSDQVDKYTSQDQHYHCRTCPNSCRKPLRRHCYSWTCAKTHSPLNSFGDGAATDNGADIGADAVKSHREVAGQPVRRRHRPINPKSRQNHCYYELLLHCYCCWTCLYSC